MKLTKISDENINDIFTNETCKKELSKKIESHKSSRLIYNLLKNISTRNTIINIFNENEDIPLDISQFIDDEISTYILKQSYKKYKISIRIENTYFTIYLFSEKEINKNKLSNIIYYFNLILKICYSYSRHTEINFTFKIFLTKFNKIEPDGGIVEPKNINSGYTTNHNKIVIYRIEELYKVFIHECFHMFCLDFSNIIGIDYEKIVGDIFKVKSDYLLFEAYCEFWARILNAAIVSYHIKKNITYKEFEKIFELNINAERCFSLLQMKRFLKSTNITYIDLIKGNPTHYIERTNGICYYVLTCILLYNYEETMEWILENNNSLLDFSKNIKSIYSFFVLIKRNYMNKDFLLSIETITLSKNIKTMYMALFEIDLL